MAEHQVPRGKPQRIRNQRGEAEAAREPKRNPTGKSGLPDEGASQPNILEVVGSSPPPLTKLQWPQLTWGQEVGLPQCPYFKRWILDFGAFSIRVHRWEGSDDERAFHDHPWWFLTLVLRGSYTDVSPAGDDRVSAGSVRFRPAEHKHTVKINQPGTWTLLLTGPPVRRWGFWVKDKLWKRDRYFAVNGHHPCANGEPVRLRPDGSTI